MLKHHTPKAHLIAAAESYAGVSRFADCCYRYYFYHDKSAKSYLQSVLANKMSEHLKAIPVRYHIALIHAVLLEITYPIKGNAKQAFTAKERACCMGISRRQYYRQPFDTVIDNMIGNIKGIALVVVSKVRQQLGKKFKINH